MSAEVDIENFSDVVHEADYTIVIPRGYELCKPEEAEFCTWGCQSAWCSLTDYNHLKDLNSVKSPTAGYYNSSFVAIRKVKTRSSGPPVSEEEEI